MIVRWSFSGDGEGRRGECGIVEKMCTVEIFDGKETGSEKIR